MKNARDTWVVGLETLTEEQVKEARRNGLDYWTVFQRMTRLRHPADKAVSLPKQKRGMRNKAKYPEEDFAIAKENGISKDTYRKRRDMGWTREKARTSPVRQKIKEMCK